MKLLSSKRRMAVVGLAVGLIAGVSGLAVAFFTTTGTGTGNAYVGQPSNVTIAQLAPNTQIVPVYDSTISPLPVSTPSYGAEAYAFNQIGNEVTLTGSGETLNNAVVTMNSWACESGSWTGSPSVCTTTSGATFNEPITLNIYAVGAGNTQGALLTSDTQTFAIPYRPSTDLVDCPAGGEWYNAATSSCQHGMNFNITFGAFSPTVALPSTVIYGISYNTDDYGPVPTHTADETNPADSLNVSFDTGSTDVSVGSDANPGNIFVNSAYATNGDLFCSTVVPDTFVTAYNDCSGVSGTPPTNDIPAVQLNATAAAGGYIDLYPGGPGEAVDFSIHNPGGGAAEVHSVTFAITGGLSAGCSPSWFSLVQPTIPNNVSIGAGATENFQPSGGSITLINEPVAQNACAGEIPQLTFTSN